MGKCKQIISHKTLRCFHKEFISPSFQKPPIFSLLPWGLQWLFPPCYLLTETSFQVQKTRQGWGTCANRPPNDSCPSEAEGWTMVEPFLLLLFVSFHVGTDSSLNYLDNLFWNKRVKLLCLLFKIEKMLWLSVLLPTKQGPRAKCSVKDTSLLGSSHAMGLNLLQLRPCSQLLRQKPEARVIVSCSLAVMCWPHRLTQGKRGVRYDRD